MGDPTIGGWLITLGYAAVAALCAVAARSVSADESRDRRFWLAVSASFAILAINKELDFQTIVNDWIRAVAKEQGWYERRDTIRALFVGTVAAGCGAMLLALLWLLRTAPRAMKLALLGLTVLGVFVVLRAAWFHHAGVLVNRGISIQQWSSILEPAGIGIVALAATIHRRSRTAPRRERL